MARDLIVSMRTLNIDFYPRESQVVTFRDPWSFPILFHPACNNLIRDHLEGLARKVRNFVIHAIVKRTILIKDLDRFPLRCLGRVPCNSVLSTSHADPRGRGTVLAPSSLCPR